MVTFLRENHVPSWSPDGKWIYFGSSRAGESQVFRMRPDGSEVQQVTHNGGEYGQVSADGKWLYYSAPGQGLWKMPPDGGEATEVLPRSELYLSLTFALTARGIYAFGPRRPQGFPAVFYPFDGGEPHHFTTVGPLHIISRRFLRMTAVPLHDSGRPHLRDHAGENFR